MRPLVVTGGASDDDDDWLNLSRKHEIEVDKEKQFVSIFGGKLTDCVIIGEEVVDILQELSIEVQVPRTIGLENQIPPYI